jgi:hypothetical protein
MAVSRSKRCWPHFDFAPVSGRAWGARHGTTAVWFGGAEGDLEAPWTNFAALAGHVFHTGALSSGTASNLLPNLHSTVLASDLPGFGLLPGLDPLCLTAAVREGSHGCVRSLDLLGFKNFDNGINFRPVARGENDDVRAGNRDWRLA